MPSSAVKIAWICLILHMQDKTTRSALRARSTILTERRILADQAKVPTKLESPQGFNLTGRHYMAPM